MHQEELWRKIVDIEYESTSSKAPRQKTCGQQEVRWVVDLDHGVRSRDRPQQPAGCKQKERRVLVGNT